MCLHQLNICVTKAFFGIDVISSVPICSPYYLGILIGKFLKVTSLGDGSVTPPSIFGVPTRLLVIPWYVVTLSATLVPRLTRQGRDKLIGLCRRHSEIYFLVWKSLYYLNIHCSRWWRGVELTYFKAISSDIDRSIWVNCSSIFNLIHCGTKYLEWNVFSLICNWTNGWAHNRYAGALRRHGTHYDVTVV